MVRLFSSQRNGEHWEQERVEVSEMEEGKGVCVHDIPINVSPAKESRRTKGVSISRQRSVMGSIQLV